jgi:hypothetical protein
VDNSSEIVRVASLDLRESKMAMMLWLIVNLWGKQEKGEKYNYTGGPSGTRALPGWMMIARIQWFLKND